MNQNTKTILNLLLTKSALKQDVHEDARFVFQEMRRCVNNEIDLLRKEVEDKRIRLHVEERNEFEFHAYVGSDVLVFQMHANVFHLHESHPIWEQKYLQEDQSRSYFGIIHIYNFLAESFLRNRINDAGYLIGRIFVNKDRHFFVEGKGQLGFLFKDLEKTELKEDTLRHIAQVSFSFALGFDLLVPPYEMVQELSVGQMQMIGSNAQVSTAKRLGFKFQSEEDENF